MEPQGWDRLHTASAQSPSVPMGILTPHSPPPPGAPGAGEWDAYFCPLPQGNMVLAQKGSLGKDFSSLPSPFICHAQWVPNK